MYHYHRCQRSGYDKLGKSILNWRHLKDHMIHTEQNMSMCMETVSLNSSKSKDDLQVDFKSKIPTCHMSTLSELANQTKFALL